MFNNTRSIRWAVENDKYENICELAKEELMMD